MGHETRDPVTGRMTTGHEWNGIEELDTPVPRVVLFFLAATILFSIVYWVLMPAWPLGWTYTKGLLGVDQRETVTKQVEDASRARAIWTDRIGSSEFSVIVADPVLMRHVRETGRTLFIDNCAVCHGVNGTGGPGYPNLAAKVWLWGGEPETLAETIRVGINSAHPQTRISQMMAFGRDGILDLNAIKTWRRMSALSPARIYPTKTGRELMQGKKFTPPIAPPVTEKTGLAAAMSEHQA